MVAIVPRDHVSAIVGFLQASGAADAARTVGAWANDVRASARFVVQFDFLYDVVHNNAVAMLAMWAARELETPIATGTARVVAWIMWAATGCNLVENVAALHMIAGGDTTPWYRIVVVSTAFRFATLWTGCALGVAGLGLAYRRRPARRV